MGGTIAAVGNEQADFDCGAGIANDDRLLAALGLKQDQKFFKECARARRRKKPVLLLVISNPDDQRLIDIALQAFAESSPMIQALLQDTFTLMVTSQE